jgi:hypothetical protein
LGVVTRERKIDVPALVEATVLAMSGLPGTQTSAFANYIQLTGEAVVRRHSTIASPSPSRISWPMCAGGQSPRCAPSLRSKAKRSLSPACY